MKTININKVIREIEHIIKGCTSSDKGIGARWGLDYAIQIIKDNIKKDDRDKMNCGNIICGYNEKQVCNKPVETVCHAWLKELSKEEYLKIMSTARYNKEV